jgi:hypothetical protein
MDPNACLDAASYALRCGDTEECLDYLDEYRTWRLKGGFEPLGGDEHERYMRRRVFSRIDAEESGEE